MPWPRAGPEGMRLPVPPRAVRLSTLPRGYFCYQKSGEKSRKHKICGYTKVALQILLTRRAKQNAAAFRRRLFLYAPL